MHYRFFKDKKGKEFSKKSGREKNPAALEEY
jgi:hypothetical protein